MRTLQNQTQKRQGSASPSLSAWHAARPQSKSLEAGAVGNQAIQRLLRSGVIQAKLTISQPNDPEEDSADRQASAVLKMPDPKAHGRASDRRLSTIPLQVHSLGATLPIGQPLSGSVRSYFEPRFGHDLSHVRTHADADAADSAARLNADAYTVGQHIVFGAARYQPHTASGVTLLAHELAHTIQQSSVRGARDSSSPLKLQRQVEGGADSVASTDIEDTSAGPILRFGARGSAVVTLQRRLNVHGADLVEDAIWGTLTEQAVRSFQGSHALAVDGVVGPLTWSELDKRPADLVSTSDETASSFTVTHGGQTALGGTPPPLFDEFIKQDFVSKELGELLNEMAALPATDWRKAATDEAQQGLAAGDIFGIVFADDKYDAVINRRVPKSLKQDFPKDKFDAQQSLAGSKAGAMTVFGRAVPRVRSLIFFRSDTQLRSLPADPKEAALVKDRTKQTLAHELNHHLNREKLRSLATAPGIDQTFVDPEVAIAANREAAKQGKDATAQKTHEGFVAELAARHTAWHVREGVGRQ